MTREEVVVAVRTVEERLRTRDRDGATRQVNRLGAVLADLGDEVSFDDKKRLYGNAFGLFRRHGGISREAARGMFDHAEALVAAEERAATLPLARTPGDAREPAPAEDTARRQ